MGQHLYRLQHASSVLQLAYRSRVSADDVDFELLLMLGAQKILRICCTPDVAWLIGYTYSVEEKHQTSQNCVGFFFFAGQVPL